MSDDRFAYQEPTFAGAGDEVAIQQFITRTYGWMSAGLALTAVVAMFVASSQEIVEFVFGNRLVFYAIIGLEFALVWMLSASVTRLPEIAAIAGFLFYAVLNGITIAVVLLVYTAASVAGAFVITALMFGGMSLYGLTTKRDLTSMGSFMIMGLWGLVIASIVNLFLRNPMMNWVMSYIGVIVFTGLSAYDAQKIKAIAVATLDDEQSAGKASIMGALTLYLDFVNLFLDFVRILGRRNNR